jgi:hypothetical protein
MESDPQAPGGARGENAAEAERRTNPRFLFPGAAACRVRPLAGADWWPALGIDVSLGGLALRLTQAPAAGQILIVELWRSDGSVYLTRLLRVAYAAPAAGGGCRVGGRFLRALAPGEFDQLLDCPGASGVAGWAPPGPPQQG